MNANAAPQCDVAGDGFRRHWATAFCVARKQLAHAADANGIRVLGVRLVSGWRDCLRFGTTCNRTCDLRQRQLAFSQSQIELFGIVKMKLGDQFGKRDRCGESLELAFQHLLALRGVLLFVLLAKPGAHLVTIALRCQEAERRH